MRAPASPLPGAFAIGPSQQGTPEIGRIPASPANVEQQPPETLNIEQAAAVSAEIRLVEARLRWNRRQQLRLRGQMMVRDWVPIEHRRWAAAVLAARLAHLAAHGETLE
jgi:hypothetical protein